MGDSAGAVLRGWPRSGSLVREGAAIAVTQPIGTGVAALIAAAVCAVILTTTGQAAASEQRVLDRIDSAGARALTVSDPSGEARIAAVGLDRIAGLPTVEWVAAFGPVGDVQTVALGAAGHPVPARSLYTDLPPTVDLTHGRAPDRGEAVAGSAAVVRLGLLDGAGSVSGSDHRGPVVGTFIADDPLEEMNRGLLMRAEPDPDAHLRTVHVSARSIDDVELLARAVPALLQVDDRLELTVESPQVLADLQAVVAGELGEASRQLMLLVLTTGLTLVAITLYGATAARRQEFGRRRALGASRSAIVTLVLLHASLAGVVGAMVGTAVGVAVLTTTQSALPSATFILGVVLLTVLAAAMAAVPPAITAALRDPVRILRVP